MFCRVCDTSQNYSNGINLIAFIFDVFCFTNYSVEFLSEGILQIEQLCKKFNFPNLGGCFKSIDLPLSIPICIDLCFENNNFREKYKAAKISYLERKLAQLKKVA